MKSLLIEPLEARIAPATLTISSPSLHEGDSGTIAMTFTVTLDAVSDQPVTVDFATIDGTATAGADYVSKMGTITFAAGETSQTIEIEIIGDTIGEADETFTVRLSDPVNATIGNTDGTGTIKNDAKFRIVGPGSVTEGHTGTTNAEFTVYVDEADPDATYEVDFATVNGTAIGGETGDFQSTSGKLTFAPGEVSKVFSVLVNGDTAGEANETFSVKLTNPVNAAISSEPGGDSATATIENDDPVFTIDSPTVIEGNNGTTILRYTVTLLYADPAATTTVKYATADGTAKAGQDYVAQNGTLTFQPGDTTQFIEVVINGDTLGEADETLTVTLSDPTGGAAVVEGTKTGTGTIVNDDLIFTIETPEGILEGDTGTKVLTFKVKLNRPADGRVTVNFATSNGTAAAGLDYIAKSGTLTFEEGEDEKTIEILIIGDTIGEDDETFFVTLSNPSTGGVLESTRKATGTILNDAKLVIAPPSLLVEGDTGSQSTNFVVTLIEANPNATVTVSYSTADGTATAGEDYVSKTNQTITFNPGVTTQTITVAVNGDSEAENDETFFVNLHDPEGATIKTGSAQATIQNNDFVTINDVTIVEGDNGKNTLVFTVTLNSVVPSGKQIRIDYNTVEGTARASTENAANDYVAANGTLIFEAGQRTKTITIEIIGDQMYEGGTEVNGRLADQFQVELSNVRLFKPGAEGDTEEWVEEKPLDYNESKGSDLTGVATIVDNDPLPAVSISDARVIEGHVGDAKIAKFRVNLSQPTDFDVRLTYKIVNGTAVIGEDVDDTTMVVIIPAGSSSAFIEVPIIGDNLLEGNETFKVLLETATLTSGGTDKALPIIDGEGIGTIVDDEAAVTLTGPAEIIEGDTGEQEITIFVTISGTHTTPIVVKYYTQDGTATSTGDRKDYEAVSGELVFAPGETAKPITIKIKGDTEIEGDQAFKLIVEADGVQFGDDPDNATGRLEKTITIKDEANEPLPTVTLENTSPTGGVTEGGQVTFKVNLSAPYTHDIVVRYLIVDDTAKAGSDYQYTAGTVLEVVIPAGQTSATFSVNTINDSLDEDPEIFKIEIKEVQYGTGEDKKIVQGGDTIGALIADNDPMPTLSIEDVSINEGDSGERTATFKIKLSAPSGRDVTVHVATLPRDATADLDYLSRSETITIPAGQTEFEFKVKVIGDQEVEGNESFLVQLTAAQNATIARGQAIGTIKDDESTYEVLFFNPVSGEYEPNISVNEEGPMGSQSEVTFIIKRTGDLSLDGQVRYTTADGIASEGIRAAVGSGQRADFTFSSALISFAANTDPEVTEQTSAPVTIKITKDTHYELTEQFRILLSDPLNGAVKTNEQNEVDHGKVTINDNDLMPTLTVTNVTANEGSTGQQTTMVFKVELSNVDETGTWTLKRKTIDGVGETGATSGGSKADYLALAEADLNFAPGEVSKNVTVTVYGDNRDEYDQTFSLDVRGQNSKGEDVAVVGTGTIIDDDAEVTVEVTDLISGSNTAATYNESDGSSTSKYFQVRLSGETEKTVKVRYYTEDGPGQYDARAGEDYIKVGRIEGLESDLSSVISVLTFAPGETSKNVFVTVINDSIVEGDQAFQMRIARHSEVPAGGETEADVTNASIGKDRGVAVIKEDPNDRPVITINDITIIEGDDLNSTQTARFTVTLAEPAQRPVFVDFTTADGTGSARGVFADYITRSGQITFAPGQLSQNVDVQVINDIYVEDDETFAVKLTAPSGTAITFGKDTGIATILNGLDTVLGIGISDVRVVENGRNSSGGNTTNHAVFKVELSKAQSSAVTVNAAVRNGTATKGADFENKNATVTIAANQKVADFSVAIVADNLFEATETFFTDLSNPSAGAQIVRGTAIGTIYNDDFRQVNSRTVQWIDVDGDLVTLKVSKGAIDINNTSMFSFIDGGTVGGRTLQVLNLAGTGSMFDEANITVSVSRQAGFDGDANGNLGDGRVNVGVIRAGTFDSGKVNFFGIDLGTIKIEGDLGTIEVGDRFLDGFALKKLDVHSFGMHPELVEVRDNGGGLIGYDRQSYVQGRVGTIKVRGDFSGIMNVVASGFGSINTLMIGGALLGNDLDNSGVVQFTGTLGKAVIGQIIGGSGDGSGRIIGDTSYKAKVGSIVVKGGVLGGTGDSSAVIQTKSISRLSIGGEVAGGAGASSGQIVVDKINQLSIQGNVSGGAGAKSGYIVGSKMLGKVSIKGGLLGGTGADSGQILATKINSITVQGDVVGGSGSQAGAIFSNSTINKVDVKGRLIGGAGEYTGFIRANGDVKSLSIRGALPAGNNSLLPDVTAAVTGGDGSNSGRIQIGGTLGSMTLGGAKLPGEVTRVSLQGGNGADSGKITANVLKKALFNGDIRGSSANSTGTVDVNGDIKSMVVKGSVIGGDSRGPVGDKPGVRVNTTGAIVGGSIGTLRITGNLQSGTDDAGVGLEGSGSIAAQGPIKKLVIDGSIIGNEDRTVNILAFGGYRVPAIGEMKVGGDVSFTNVITGTAIRNVAPGQTVINADAEVRTVKIGGDVKGLNITAGASAGADGKFGTADDRLLTGTFGFSDPTVYSKIAKVIIGGQVIGVGDGETKDPYGLIAQHIGSVTVGGTKVKLQKGAGNDRAENAEDLTPGVEIAPGTNFRAIELPIP